MVPNPEMSSSDPAPPYQSPSDSSWSSSLPVETGSPAYGAPPSQYTPPPAESPSSYEPMPYSSFVDGGYSQMDCGYGYKKGADGKCAPESWVCPPPTAYVLTFPENELTGCDGIHTDRVCFFSGTPMVVGAVTRLRSSLTRASLSKSTLPSGSPLIGQYLILCSSQHCPPPSTVTVTDKSVETQILTVTYTQVFSVLLVRFTVFLILKTLAHPNHDLQYRDQHRCQDRDSPSH